jgi:antitoxin (DNA-binding transcriptional repressor) of toxin-antitoxin stability system
MIKVTAKRLHQQTKDVLNQLEQGEPFIVTRNGRTIGRLSPIKSTKPVSWNQVMDEVWAAQKRVKASDRAPNPVLKERQRRRR